MPKPKTQTKEFGASAKANMLAQLKTLNIENAGTSTLRKFLNARSTETKQGLKGNRRAGVPTGLPETAGGQVVGRLVVTGAIRRKIEGELKQRERKALLTIIRSTAKP